MSAVAMSAGAGLERSLSWERTTTVLGAISPGPNHGWRAALSRGPLSPSARERVRKLHVALHEALARVVRELGQPQPELTVAVVRAVVDACIRRIDQGDDLTTVSDFAAGATRRLLADDDVPQHP
ncbi:hypothetical protein [Streptomyces sp. NPDC005012]|uniref:hypothetical protein n=1 Tax=Streptomyces sp. NPDC005012 TaxID=3154558 RepID=UPI0033B9A15A